MAHWPVIIRSEKYVETREISIMESGEEIMECDLRVNDLLRRRWKCHVQFGSET